MDFSPPLGEAVAIRVLIARHPIRGVIEVDHDPTAIEGLVGDQHTALEELTISKRATRVVGDAQCAVHQRSIGRGEGSNVGESPAAVVHAPFAHTWLDEHRRPQPRNC